MLPICSENLVWRFLRRLTLGDTMNAQKPDVARAYSILARWRDLAEKRLDHHIELYQTGRWQRYYNETEFLTMIRELVNAVEAWRQLAPREQAKSSAQTQQLAAFNVWTDLGGGDVTDISVLR